MLIFDKDSVKSNIQRSEECFIYAPVYMYCVYSLSASAAKCAHPVLFIVTAERSLPKMEVESGKWKVSSHACFEVLTISSRSVHTDSYLSLSPARRAPSAGGNQMAPCYKSSVTSECVWVEERMRNKCTVWDQTKATVSLKTTCVIPLLKKGDVHLPCAQTGTW